MNTARVGLSEDIAYVAKELTAVTAKLDDMLPYRRESRWGKAQERYRDSLQAQIERLNAEAGQSS